MANKRVYYAVKAVGISPESTTDFVTVKGCQDIGITTTFNVEDISELGQLEVYESIEGIPDIEVTMSKVLDGDPLIYHLCTRGFTTSTLAGRSNQKCEIALSIFDDTQDNASGTPQAQVDLSGMFMSTASYAFPTEGQFTESVTVVGNNKRWRSSGFTFSGSLFDGTDEPLALTSGTGGIQQRENLKFEYGSGIALDTNSMVNTQFDDLSAGNNSIAATVLPPDVDGISASGTNDKTADVFGAHISNITVNADLGRENILELGRRGPYFRFVNFPVEVTCDIEVITVEGDKVDAIEDTETNLTNRTIKIATDEGTFVNLGLKNKLTSVTYGGATTGGEEGSVTYSYRNLNSFTISHPQDPA